MKRAFLISAVVLTLVLPGAVFAKIDGEVIQETFEDVSAASQGSTTGRSGQGWVQLQPGEEGPVWPVSLEDARIGIISFDIKRIGGNSGMDRDTVFELLDSNGGRVLRLQISWSIPGRGTVLFLNSLPSREYYRSGMSLWSPVIYLDREMPKGQWVHLDLLWDDDKGEYTAFADGKPLNAVLGHILVNQDGTGMPDSRAKINEKSAIRGEPKPFFDRPFQYFLQQTANIALGSYPATNRPEGRERTLLTHSVLDNFEISTHPGTSIESVIHDGFARAGYSGKLVEGDTVSVVLEAEPGGRAAFDIVQPEKTLSGKIIPSRAVAADVPLTEDETNPGTYRGFYTVRAGDYVESGQVVGRFTSYSGLEAGPLSAERPVSVDGRVHLSVNSTEELVLADEGSVSEITVVATDANGKKLRDRELNLTMSTTDEYTGLVGGGSFEDQVGATLDVEWKGVTDSFGEVAAEYVSGFAAKTILISAKDMSTGDVGVGWVRSYINGMVDIVVKQPAARALAVTGSMDVTVSRDWLTADGRSRSRITAVVKDTDGNPMEGNQISFNLLSDNGSIREIQTRTDSRGRAYADYIAGKVVGQVQIEVRDMTSGLVAVVGIELRPDAPAEVSLTAEPGEIFIGDLNGSQITARVTDINGNPNTDTDVLFEIAVGEGTVSAPKVSTDNRDGVAEVTFLPGNNPGVSTVKATVMSREPTEEELKAAEGAVFLYGLEDDPGRLDVLEWLAEPEDDVVEGQDLVVLEDRAGDTYTVKAPRDGTLATFVAEERDRVEYGQTLGYVLPLPE